MENSAETACRVCGPDDGEELFDRHGLPQYVICDCCYNESGIGDDTLMQVRELRGLWVGHGARWHRPARKPADWDLLTQIANIPPRWR
ncbi:hypothetical protein SAMN06272735_7765 [Streptomyces sp. TLI_55]|uniref:hypothetical protein n=1 Tax=Streptomyces sp. TLI_55 TaxID=1938861 RepID=UPI000BD28203|nr:hypothetical protein [Streptomyces sp. TLI_55]SNX65923.1 hypothetical protein SAMN06272735_7765 [Streptomyces sp. TLI_55]